MTDFQKNGMYLNGADLLVNVHNNTVTGAGPVSFNVQNGIVLLNGPGGTVLDNTVSNFSYLSANTACGILLYNAAPNVLTSGNTVNNSQAGIFYYQSSGSITNNIITNTLAGMGATAYW